MMFVFGKQTRYCPNCGAKHYDSNIYTNEVVSMCCDFDCREEWEMKYTRVILGKDGPPDDTSK